MHFEFTGELWYWRGPAPHYFVTVPEEQCHDIRAVASLVTYGWGMIPVTVQLCASTWATSLFPKDGRYIVPIKARVRKVEQLAEGDSVTLGLQVRS